MPRPRRREVSLELEVCRLLLPLRPDPWWTEDGLGEGGGICVPPLRPRLTIKRNSSLFYCAFFLLFSTFPCLPLKATVKRIKSKCAEDSVSWRVGRLKTYVNHYSGWCVCPWGLPLHHPGHASSPFLSTWVERFYPQKSLIECPSSSLDI